MKKLILLGLTLSVVSFYAQDDGDEDWDFDTKKSGGSSDHSPAFYDTRVINSQSVETLEKGTFDLRIAHRFGELATKNSYKTLFGLDNISDVRIGLDYAVTDNILIGIHRNKGAGPYSQIYEGMFKYKIMDQQNGRPFTLTVASSAFATAMDGSTDSTSLVYFTNTSQRFSYFSQIILARNLGGHASIQMNAGYLHRNLVYFDDVNDAFSLGGVAKIKVAKKISIIGEYNHLFRPTSTINTIKYYDPIGLGVEFKTFAHVFQINITNSRGMGAIQYLPYTTSNISKGQYRLGFTISRHF